MTAEECEPEKKREKMQQTSMLMATDEKHQPNGENSEIKMYLEDQIEVDSGQYPKLARRAKYMHSIPFMSTPLERLFLKASFIVIKAQRSVLEMFVNITTLFTF